MAMENFHRRRHEWLYKVVSGTGSWKGGQGAKLVKLGDRGAGRTGEGKSCHGSCRRGRQGWCWEVLPGKAAGPKGGNSYPFPY
jgi:hypothetical protein